MLLFGSFFLWAFMAFIGFIALMMMESSWRIIVALGVILAIAALGCGITAIVFFFMALVPEIGWTGTFVVLGVLAFIAWVGEGPVNSVLKTY